MKLRVFSVSLLALLVAGCATPSFQMGKKPQFERLDDLTPGVSTKQNVITVFGKPQGHGATRSQSYGLKDAWLYESMKLEGGKGRMHMLMVFFDKDTGIYQGHMWLSSGMLFGQTK